MDLVILIAPLLAHIIATAAPGPATVSIANAALIAGPRSANRHSLGLGLSDAIWGLPVAAGLGALITSSETVLSAIQIGGGLVLIWFAWGAARSALVKTANGGGAEAGMHWFRRGLVLNFLNSAVPLGWIAVIALASAAEASHAELLGLWLLASVISFVIYLGYAALFSAGVIRRGYRVAARPVDGLVALLFAAAGLHLISGSIAAQSLPASFL